MREFIFGSEDEILEFNNINNVVKKIHNVSDVLKIVAFATIILSCLLVILLPVVVLNVEVEGSRASIFGNETNWSVNKTNISNGDKTITIPFMKDMNKYFDENGVVKFISVELVYAVSLGVSAYLFLVFLQYFDRILLIIGKRETLLKFENIPLITKVVTKFIVAIWCIDIVAIIMSVVLGDYFKYDIGITKISLTFIVYIALITSNIIYRIKERQY